MRVDDTRTETPVSVGAVESRVARPGRDLAAFELWQRSHARSRERRARLAAGELRRRSLVSAALVDLDGPRGVPARPAAAPERDLASAELWDFSAALARSRRRAARKPVLHQARAAGASLVVAAVAASVPATGSSQSRASSGSATQVDSRLLRVGSRGPAVAALQRALGIRADGIFGPQTRKAVRAFQARNGLVADGVVGPQTRAALARVQAPSSPSGFKSFRAPWVAPVQRALGIPADGVFGPQTRAAVKAFQAKRGLVADGVVGPQTLAALGLSHLTATSPGGGGAVGGGGGGASAGSGSAQSSRALTALRVAQSHLGKPYARGGNGPRAFDCSGLVVASFRQAGIALPRTSYAQYGAGRPVARRDVRAGDLVFFSTAGPGASHVGIALNGSSFISTTTRGVRVQPLGGDYWGRHYVGARRIA